MRLLENARALFLCWTGSLKVIRLHHSLIEAIRHGRASWERCWIRAKLPQSASMAKIKSVPTRERSGRECATLILPIHS